jgi:hypothetical protein
MKKLVHGIGINDADYEVQPLVNGKVEWCPFYRKWHSMIGRCYSKKRHLTQPTYINCTVCDEWLTFSKFKAWMECQDWEGKQIDKDILKLGNKVYCPDACIFIAASLNTLLTDHAAKRGDYSLGVSWDRVNSKFYSQINVNGIPKNLGRFTDQEAAHKAWQKAKNCLIKDAAIEQTDFSV